MLVWANQPTHSFLVGCLIPCLQGTSVRVGSSQPKPNMCGSRVFRMPTDLTVRVICGRPMWCMTSHRDLLGVEVILYFFIYIDSNLDLSLKDMCMWEAFILSLLISIVTINVMIFLQSILNAYTPSQSSTAKPVLCSDPLCAKSATCASTDQCPYEIKYVSANTSTSGTIYEDVLYFMPEAGGNPVTLPIYLGWVSPPPIIVGNSRRCVFQLCAPYKSLSSKLFNSVKCIVFTCRTCKKLRTWYMLLVLCNRITEYKVCRLVIYTIYY